jgi:hypothetical protein
MSAAGQSIQCSANSTDAPAYEGEPGSVRSVHEHEYVDGEEMGAGEKRPYGPALKLLELIDRKGLEALL